MSQNEGYYGGGGYLSQPGGSPFGQSPSSNRKSDASHALRPLTVHMIKKASQAHSDAEWMLDGHEVGQLTIIGTVVDIKRQATNVSFTINDGTGRVEARHWIDTTIPEAEGLSDEELTNTYAHVTGNLKMFGSKRYINALHIRKVEDPHQFYHHMLEVMTVSLTLERGPPPRPGQENKTPSNFMNTGGASAYSAQTVNQQPMDQFSKCTPLQKKIIHFLLNEQNEDGTHVAMIATHVGGNATEISDALEALLADGHVYTTISEEHFLVSR